MKKVSLLVVCCVAVAALAVNVKSAKAFPDFKKEFDTKYKVASPSTDSEKALAAAVATAKCNVCHEGESKKGRNAYGKALDELLTKDDKKDTAKIQKALTDVEGKQAGNGKSFGENLKAGKLPTGG